VRTLTAAVGRVIHGIDCQDNYKDYKHLYENDDLAFDRRSILAVEKSYYYG